MLRVEKQGAIGIWALDRPESKNAIGKDLIDAFVRALDAVEHDRELRALILTGSRGAFCAGADLREVRAIKTTDDAGRFSDIGEEIFRRFEALPFPVIAAISGVAFGGGAELALACDLRVADASARIAFKQVRMGVATAWGTLPRLVSVVGHGTAMRLLTTAHEIGAMEARVLGLVDRVTDENGDSLALAIAWATDIEQGAPGAVAAMKSLIVASRKHSYDVMRALERADFVSTWTSPDHVEAVEAYFERRAPHWKARGA
jgi:enoyl-CoA hydratase